MNPRRLTIRRMTPADAEAVAWLDRASNPLPWSCNAYRREPARSHSHPWVVEAVGPAAPTLDRAAGSSALLGFLVVWYILDEAHIANLAVHPDFRRQGIGARLLAHALRQAARAGMVSAQLEVRAGNQAAIALYRRFGFEEVGRRKGYYQNNHEDALLLTCEPLSRFLEKE